MKYPKPTDRYNCSVLCDNFEEIEERLSDLEEGGVKGAVSSVNGKTGDVVLKTSDLVNDKEYVTKSELGNVSAVQIITWESGD